MQEMTISRSASRAGDVPEPLVHLRRAIEHAAHLLPAQGPITVFVHHNTLHAFEDLPFTEAVIKGGKTFGCQPFLSEDRYREFLARGRITLADISAVLLEEMGDETDCLVGLMGTRFHLWLAMLQYPLRQAPGVELRWLVAETDALRRFRDDIPAPLRRHMIDETRHWVMRDLRNGRHHGPAERDQRIQNTVAGLFDRFGKSTIENWSDAAWESFCLHLLWRICHNGVHGIPSFTTPPQLPLRPRDLLLEATGVDSDLLVHDLLIRFCAAFLDQGFADWQLPDRDRGFYAAFVALYGQGTGSPEPWLRGLKSELVRLRNEGVTPLECLDESLQVLGVAEEDWEPILSKSLLALGGWAGMIWQTETREDRAALSAPPGSLVEFLAIRLLLERFALSHVAKDSLGFKGPLRDLRKAIRPKLPKHDLVDVDQRAFLVFQLAQVLGWKPQELYRLTKQEWTKLLEEIEAFSRLERQKIYHLAYERRYRLQTLDAILAHDKHRGAGNTNPSFQVICCIDEREESYRRHLEELAPESETFGAAGFFAIAIYYRGAADAHFVPLCPVIIRPQHYIQEEVVYTFQETHRRRAKTRRLLGTAIHRLHVGSRSFAGGALAALFGSLASFPLVARVLFPRLTARMRRLVGRVVQTPPVTKLQIERTAANTGPAQGEIGYTVTEMAGIVERLLGDMGLTSNFARLIIVTGHGSSSLNNPHESAHDCGACGGGRGGPNARAFAQMANDLRVRELLRHNALILPEEVVFVGAYHNTCDESLTWFDLDRLPASHRDEFERVKVALDRTRERNAHERCRRFESAPLTLTSEAALRHVEGRAEDLAQTRPEYGHATNALSIVGRRSRTRGLFLDRRAFLTSYDPAQDDDQFTILERILQAVIPVCAGINLEYYFSFTDPAGWGCGTKLPHNISSLVGVMDGAASDLRPGLPWQMVEIHEPVRLLFIIETTPDAMLRIMENNDGIHKLCLGGWVQLATLDPESPTIHVFRDGRFELYRAENTTMPEVDSSVDWYSGWRDHLGFAGVKQEVD